MSFDYQSGLVVAFLIGLVKVFTMVSEKMSVRNSNMAKVGHHLSYWTGKYTESKGSGTKFFSYFIYTLVITPLFSWLTVFSAVISYIIAKTNAPPLPEKLKEFQFKVDSVDLPKEAMQEMIAQICQLMGVPVPVQGDIAKVEDGDDPDCWWKNEEGWYSEFKIDRTKKTGKRYSHTPEYDCEWFQEFEYKVLGSKVFIKVINSYQDNLGVKEFDIRDGVVLDSEILKRKAESKFFREKETLEEIEQMKLMIEMHELEPKMSYFVLSRHPELMPSADFKKKIRSDMERIVTGKGKVIEEARKLGAVVASQSGQVSVTWPPELPEEQKTMLQDLFSEGGLKSHGLNSSTEFWNTEPLINDLEKIAA